MTRSVPATTLRDYDLLTILGPTASGKTQVAVALARRFNAEIISGDSRQVYRGMDIGTGKDLDDYGRGVEHVPYHLIDIAEPGTRYNVYDFQRHFLEAYNTIHACGHKAILCGGSGLYLESVLRGYRLPTVPENRELRDAFAGKSIDELTAILASYKTLHNKTDVDSPQRAIRAIEIADYERTHAHELAPFPQLSSLIIGIDVSREVRRQRISERLDRRLSEGMVDEIRGLLARGVKADDLIYYGLEYKYVTLYVTGRLNYDDMRSKLEIAIHQFAKRQMTWFRGMERRGLTIRWLTQEEAIQLDAASL